MATPEISRRLQLRGLNAASEHLVEATPAELVRVAVRLSVPAVASLRCRFLLQRADAAGRIDASGVLDATLTQICVVTDEPFEASLSETFLVRFVPEDDPELAEDAELDPDADDVVPYVGTCIELGEAAIEQLALAMPAYPRKPGAELPDVLDDDAAPEAEPERPNPFERLRRQPPQA